MTTISCFLAIKEQFSNILNHVCFEKLNTKKLRICAKVIYSGFQVCFWINWLYSINFKIISNFHFLEKYNQQITSKENYVNVKSCTISKLEFWLKLSNIIFIVCSKTFRNICIKFIASNKIQKLWCTLSANVISGGNATRWNTFIS